MREHPDYRDVLETVLTANCGKLIVSQKRAAEILGVCTRTAKSRYGVGKDGVAAAVLAKKMCK